MPSLNVGLNAGGCETLNSQLISKMPSTKDNGASSAPVKKAITSVFDHRISTGNILVILGFLLTLVAGYGEIEAWKASVEVRITNIEARQNAFDRDNLPPRVSSLEAQTRSLQGGLTSIHQDLMAILTTLNPKADRR